MRFRIDRASGREDQPPTQGAVRRSYTAVHTFSKERMNVEVFKASQKRMSDRRTLHEFDDRIELHIPTKAWFIEVDTLEDLMRLIKNEGRIVVELVPHQRCPEITIYDDYLE